MKIHNAVKYIFLVYLSLVTSYSAGNNGALIKAFEENLVEHYRLFPSQIKNVDIENTDHYVRIQSSLPHARFNTALYLNWDDDNASEIIQKIIAPFRTLKLPCAFYETPSSCCPNLLQELKNYGDVSAEYDSPGMLTHIKPASIKSPLIIKRVLDEKTLHDYFNVYMSYGFDPNPLTHQARKRFTMAFTKDELSQLTEKLELYIGYINEKPVVVGELLLHGGIAGMYSFITVPEERRKGFGSTILQYMLNRSHELGYAHACLLTPSKNSAKNVYKRCSFETICTVNIYNVSFHDEIN